MDPNANLAEQRRIREEVLTQALSDIALANRAERLAELSEALDEWIAGGGFLPKEWQRER